MAVKKILQLGNPILRKKCGSIKNTEIRKYKKTIKDLQETLKAFRKRMGYGRGIAAPQIGVLKRIICIGTQGKKWIVVNPQITERSKKMFEVWDSCFSFDIAFFCKVKRHWKITVEFRDEQGKKQCVNVRGALSELLQHEIDHLDGILAIDRMVGTKFICMRSEFEKKTRLGL